VFVIMGVSGLALTAFALTTRHYRVLSARYRSTAAAEATPVADDQPEIDDQAGLDRPILVGAAA
jgi:hypothetical protein